MIFGHSFDFKDEPVLNKNSILDVQDNTASRNIQVLLAKDDTVLKNFSFKSEWIDLSAQKGRQLGVEPILKFKIDSWGLEIKDVLTLVWVSKEKKIFYIKGKNYTARRLRFWIFHTFFPIVLELEEIYNILHVGSVEINKKPVVFSALSFGGKSTLTDYFIQKGHTMLSDDSLGIEKRGKEYYAIASYPYHRPYREPEELGYFTKNFANEPKPLHAVYILKKSSADAVVKIEELKGIEKFKSFYYSSFLNISFMKKNRFDFFTDIAKLVPVYRVVVPWDIERLDEVYNAIIEHNK
jgi:hypothetical protein